MGDAGRVDESPISRLERLEKRVRLLTGSGVCALALLGLGLGFVEAPAGSQALEAREFVVRDSGGAVRARWAFDQRETALVVNDEHGTARLRLLVDRHGPRVVLYDAKGKEQASLVSLVKPVLTLSDADERIRAQLEVEQTGPFLTLYDEKEVARALVGVGEKGPVLKLYEADGRALFSRP